MSEWDRSTKIGRWVATIVALALIAFVGRGSIAVLATASVALFFAVLFAGTLIPTLSAHKLTLTESGIHYMDAIAVRSPVEMRIGVFAGPGGSTLWACFPGLPSVGFGGPVVVEEELAGSPPTWPEIETGPPPRRCFRATGLAVWLGKARALTLPELVVTFRGCTEQRPGTYWRTALAGAFQASREGLIHAEFIRDADAFGNNPRPISGSDFRGTLCALLDGEALERIDQKELEAALEWLRRSGAPWVAVDLSPSLVRLTSTTA